jgi:glycosyltransferase involved in cell wall biosynthesis
MGDVGELASAIEMLGSKPEWAQQMGRAGREVVRLRHDPASHYSTMLSLYEELVRNGGRRKLGLVAPAMPRPPTQMQGRKAAPSAATIATPTRKLRVAFIGGRGVISKYSGIEAYYEEVGKRLADLGHEVTVYCRNHFTPPQAEHNGMRLVRLPTIRSKHLETLVHTALSTLHALTQRYDIAHYHALGPALFSFLPRLVGEKSLVTVQGLDWQRKKWGRAAASVLRLGERASVRLPNATMVVSKVLQRHFRETFGAEPFYVPNGGVLREWRPPRKILEWGLTPEKYILFLGRFSPEKGCHLLVEAFERLEGDVKLVMAGGSSYSDDYSRDLRLHAGERIRILDWVSGEPLDELLTNAMLFVLPSDLEGLSLALLDAMGAGLCVLTSDVPENREAMDGAGLTFERGSVADLSDRLRFLIANPAVREAAGKAARRKVEEQYQWQNIVVDIEKTYFELLGWNPPPAISKKPSARAAAAAGSGSERRAG